MRYLLDTNICIYILKRSPERVYQHFQSQQIGDIGISSITFCELQYGVSKSSKREENQLNLSKFLAPLEVLYFPSRAAPIYGNIRSQLEHSGKPIGTLDLLIGAHALYERLTLVTNNTKEFERIPDLDVVNWVK